MRSAFVIKTGSLQDPDEYTRGKVKIINIPEQVMGEEDVRIKIAYCAICGSDPHLVENIFGWKVPFGLGHELSGVVIDVGKKATKKGLKVGDRVSGNFLKFCGTCYYCQNGQQQFCEYANEYNRPGISEFIVWHESQVYKLPDDISLRKGCLLEPISIAVRMMDKVSMKIGQRVAICGGGPIGLLGLQAIKMLGSTSLTLIEPIDSRRSLALQYGADYVINPIDTNVQEVCLEITHGRGFDIVIDCSGSTKAVELLPCITARGGILIYGAMYPNKYEMPLNLYKYCYLNEICITGFYVAPFAFPRAMQLIKKFKLNDFIRKVYPIENIEGAFAAHLSGKHLKILIKCNEIADKTACKHI